MKQTDAGTSITTNDGLVRLRIFDGIIPPDDYHLEMAELERNQHAGARKAFFNTQTRLEKRIAELEAALHRAENVLTGLAIGFSKHVAVSQICDEQHLIAVLKEAREALQSQ